MNNDIIITGCKPLKGLEIQEILEQVSYLQQRGEEAEHWQVTEPTPVWNEREATQDVRAEIMELLTLLTPEDKEKMGSLVGTVNPESLGVSFENATRHVIVHFPMRSFCNKIGKVSPNKETLKTKCLQAGECG